VLAFGSHGGLNNLITAKRCLYWHNPSASLQIATIHTLNDDVHAMRSEHFAKKLIFIF
jgi:hypothetical protein